MTEEHLTREEKLELLRRGRAAIGEKLGRTPAPAAEPPEGALADQAGAFVTLHKKGALRGCIGRFVSTEPLTSTIEDMAQAAAFQDPRFPPLKPDELDDVDLEISVLTPMRRVQDPDEIKVGEHGIYIIRGPQRGVLLPQVAVEQGWDRETFLNQTCIKAGLSGDCWRQPETEIYVFSAEIFNEDELA